MAAVIELKYFNTFWLKKLKTITDVVPGETTINPNGNQIDGSGTTYTVSTSFIKLQSYDGNWWIIG